MQFIILFFIFLSSTLLANCNLQNIERSDKLYEKAYQEPNITKKILLLEASLKACYAPEILSYLLMIRVEISDDVYQKISYYKEILGVVVDFENKEKALKIQNHCNLKLSQLYKSINKEVSNIYKKKAEAQNTLKRAKPTNYLPWISISLLLFLWVFWDLLKKLGIFLKSLV